MQHGWTCHRKLKGLIGDQIESDRLLAWKSCGISRLMSTECAKFRVDSLYGEQQNLLAFLGQDELQLSIETREDTAKKTRFP